ncbi:hypothetical protein MKX03_021462, partial [Papaver bracteatum]
MGTIFLLLDPAIMKLPYGGSIDIRDTVKYEAVMKQYNLGPNGGILTSLNLFATKFDEVVSVIEKCADQARLSYSTRPHCLRFWPLTRLMWLSMSLPW